MMQMQRDTAALMAHLKLHNTAASKLDLLGEMIAASPGISAAGLRDAMDKAEINPATKECANKWLADQKPASKPPAVAKAESNVPSSSKPKGTKPKTDAPSAKATASTEDPSGRD